MEAASAWLASNWPAAEVELTGAAGTQPRGRRGAAFVSGSWRPRGESFV